jgi:hypothetical protein
LKAIFDFAGQSALGIWMRESRYNFPIFEMVHLLGLALLLGSIVLLNLRFFGIGLRRLRVSEVAQDLAPWTRLALMMMVFSGIPLFCSKAEDLWDDDPNAFFTKMSLILFGLVFHYAVQVPMARRENLSTGRAAAVVSLATWFGAAIAGLSLEFI